MAILLMLELIKRPTLDWLVGIGFLAGLIGGGVLGAFGGIALTRGFRTISWQ
jgi:hypothetical protein